jgi:hypothetical protein
MANSDPRSLGTSSTALKTEYMDEIFLVYLEFIQDHKVYIVRILQAAKPATQFVNYLISHLRDTHGKLLSPPSSSRIFIIPQLFQDAYTGGLIFIHGRFASCC